MQNRISTYASVLAGLLVCIAGQVRAQTPEVMEVAARYKDEHAVIWDKTEHMTLRFEDGKLEGSSEVSRQILLLSDKAPGLYNTDEFYHGFFHTLEDFSAVTLVPAGDDYKKVKATEFSTTNSEESYIFFGDGKRTKVTYPSLVRYAQTQLTYSLRHSDAHLMPGFYFQSYIPVRHAIYKITVPKSVNLGYSLQGLNTDLIKYRVEEGKHDRTHIWEAENIPGAKHYSDAPAAAYYIAHVVPFVKDYTKPRTDAAIPMLSSVGDLYHYYYDYIKDVNTELDGEMTAITDSLVKGQTIQKKKAAAIYNWVQGHLRYVAYEDSFGGYIPRPANLVCSRRFGDCKDMTSVLVAMCRKAGLDAHFAWIGTRDIPYTYERLPVPANNNHMICVLHIDDEWIFVDGTDRSIPFGYPPAALQEKEALVAIDAKTYKVIKVPVAPADRNKIIDSSTVDIKGDSLQGVVSTHFSGYGAWRMASSMQYTSQSERDETLRAFNKRGSDKYVETDSRFLTDIGDAKESLTTARFALPAYVRRLGDETYINLNLNRAYDDEYADQDRKVPVAYRYNQHLQQVVTLSIPQGFKASYLPPDKSDAVDGLWSYKIKYQQQGNKVVLTKDFFFNSLMIEPSRFAAHNKLIDGLRESYGESIVLTRLK